MNRFVVHIYGDEGIQMQLAQKINVYLPITVSNELSSSKWYFSVQGLRLCKCIAMEVKVFQETDSMKKYDMLVLHRSYLFLNTILDSQVNNKHSSSL